MIKTTFALLILFGATAAHAFPEMVRHGYANCTTCHYSPTGGGILTAYGRALSTDILSAAGTEKEAKFLYGAVETPGWLDLGGDFRLLHLLQNRAGHTLYNIIPMQMDVQAAVTVGSVAAVTSFGASNEFQPISRQHYVLWHASDKLAVRGGRFLPAYGINTENHSLAMRRGEGRDQATETYNIEASWIGESQDLFITAVFGRPDNVTVGAETGATVTTSFSFSDRFKVGASYFYGMRDVAQRQLAGPFAILGFTPHFFMLAELDLQVFRPTGSAGSQTGFIDDIRLDYEVMTGLHCYLTQEYAQPNTAIAAYAADSYGVGVQWFPRPHLELNSTFQLQRIGGANAPFAKYGWLLMHFYL